MILWNLLLTIIRVYFFILIPLNIAFSNSFLYTNLKPETVACELFILFDFLLRFNTIYYDEGRAVEKRKAIFMKHMNF